jgi:hypothetical protein
MSSAAPEPRPVSDWAYTLDSIAEDLVRALAISPEPAMPPSAPAPEEPAAPPPEAVIEVAPQDPASLSDAVEPASPLTPPAAVESAPIPPALTTDSPTLVAAIRHLQAASVHLEHLQACLEQAEQGASLANGQLAIETELLTNFRAELVEARQKLAGWTASTVG